MKQNIWVSSAQASELLIKQLATWPLIQKNYHDLQLIETKVIDFDNFSIHVQYNPTRITSTSAATDSASISQRKCFLCSQNLPFEQIRLPFGAHYYVLCNPYPIFQEHFTIPSRVHERQEIAKRFPDLLDLAYRMNQHTIFYNGPRSGASAPDHAHFQAVSRGQMPLEEDISGWRKKENEILDLNGAKLFAITQYLRNGFLIETTDRKAALSFFDLVYHSLDMPNDYTEPGMNLFCRYLQNSWQIIIIPRQSHRPWQFKAKGDEQFMSSPGAADMGGMFITPRKEDFEKVTPALIRDIYEQVGYPDEKIRAISERIIMKYKINNNL